MWLLAGDHGDEGVVRWCGGRPLHRSVANADDADCLLYAPPTMATAPCHRVAPQLVCTVRATPLFRKDKFDLNFSEAGAISRHVSRAGRLPAGHLGRRRPPARTAADL